MKALKIMTGQVNRRRTHLFFKIYIPLLKLKVTNIYCKPHSAEIAACFSATSTPLAMIEQLR